MANLQKVIKLTQAQYDTLAAGGTVGQYTGLDDNYIYLVKDTNTYATEDYVDAAIEDLSTVAKTGSYNDLLNKPTIPTVSASSSAVSGATTAQSLNINGTSWNLPSGGGGGDHYPTTFTWTNGTTAGPTGSLTGNSGFTAVSFGAIPSASSDQSGIITTSTQTFAGSKTFNSKVVIGKSSLSSPTTVLDVGKTSYGGGFTFYSAGTSNGGYLEGQFNSSVATFPYIKDISQVVFRKGYGGTHAIDTYAITLTSTSQPTANRTITLPDQSGTVALTSDLPQIIDLRGL